MVGELKDVVDSIARGDLSVEDGLVGLAERLGSPQLQVAAAPPAARGLEPTP